MISVMAERLKVGLALGSGAARGLAHIGVISVLQENGIPIDFVAGTSIGAIVGGYYAIDCDIKPFEAKISKMTKKDYLSLVDLTSKKGLIKGEKVKRFLKEIMSDKSFGDTKIPVKMIAADLLSGNEVVIDSGKLADGARASSSLPGIFCPVEIDGKVLVDGGLVNPTPVETVRKMGADVVIAVDLPVVRIRKDTDLTIVSALMQSFEIMRNKISRLEEDDKTLIITPNVSAHGTMNGHEFYNISYIEEVRKACRDEMLRIKKLLKI